MENINVVYSADNNYVMCAYVSIYSLKRNCNKNYNYTITILYDSVTLSKENINKFNDLNSENFSIKFFCVDKLIENLKSKFVVRDYYTSTIYYRLFIPQLFANDNKVIYLDCDTIILDDISKFFNTDLTGYILGACSDEVIMAYKVFQDYATKVIGVNNYLEYFNSGVLLINVKEFLDNNIYNRFLKLLDEYPFIVAPDQDCLNVLCKGRVKFLDKGWNRNPIDMEVSIENLSLIHYNLTSKPWHYKGIMFEEYFWEYAKQTEYYNELINLRETYPESKKIFDKEGGEDLFNKAINEVNRPDNYYNKFVLKK